MADALNRFANIFWHYHSGPLFGFNQKLWPQERKYSRLAQYTALAVYIAEFAALVFIHLSPLPRLGLALIVFSPQWAYIYPLPHPVFEFRGYGMAAGMALIVASIHPFILLPLAIFWFRQSVHRHYHITEPLRFWTQAQEENHGS